MKGFTLLELLIVLTIIAIVTAVTVMAFGDFGRERQLRFTVDQLQNSIILAQQQAILESATLRLTFKANGYYYTKLNDKERWQDLPHDRLSKLNAFSKKTHWNLGSNPIKEIVFSPNGLISPFQFSIQTKNGKTFCLKVSQNANVKVTSHCQGEAHA